ncbi:Fc.00g038170.m01.CDS01 [Cosmosporella sp. VM-42]
MASTNTFFRASRPLFRQGAFGAQTRQAFRAQGFGQRFGQSGKRWQSTADGAQQQAKEGWFKRMWESEIGFKTVHFWAPVMKWALVLAGVSDFARPAEKLSFTQNLALTCTGIIWTRWCLIIKPQNYLLAAVNFFLGMVGLVQISRIAIYENSKKNGGLVEDVKKEVAEVKGEAKEKIKA